MTELKISAVYSKDSVHNVSLNFQNGYTKENYKSNECRLLSDKKTNNNTVITTLNGMLFAGEETNDDLVRTLLMARDRTTGKVRIIETTAIDMKPVFRSASASNTLLETSNLELSRKFGSKKQKQQMEQREKLKVNAETVSKQMKTVTKNITIDKLDLSLFSKTDDEDMYIPPINRDAATVDEVYDIDLILTEEQYDQIYSEIEDKDYISDMVPVVKNLIAKKSLSKKHTVLALYASTLLKMFASQSKEFTRKSFVICPLSFSMNEITLTNFTLCANNRRTRPNPLKDKAICHSIVCMLLINDFKIGLEALSTAAKLSPVTIAIKAKAVGAHIVSGNDKKVIQLKLPLNTSSGFKRRKSAKF